ncbi:MAG: sensor histidine kinase [Kofleriaceae bacterium]
MGAGDGTELAQDDVIHRLGERIKELTALHRAAMLLLNNRGPDDDRIRTLIDLLPPAMQYPDIASACLHIDGHVIASANHAPSPWTLSVPFETSYGTHGQLDVVYREDRAFLVEETSLMQSIVEMLRASFDREHFVRVVEEQNTWFTLALDAGMGVWEWNLETNTTRWSPQIAQMLGIEKLTGVRGDLREMFHPDDREQMEARLEAAADGTDDLEGMEFRMASKTGWRRMSCRARVIRTPPARATRVIIAAIDVTTRRGLEESLLQSQKVEALGQVAAGVAHDFNNVLVIALSNLQMLREEMPADHEWRAMVDDTYAAAERGRALTRQLLTFSRKTSFKPEAIDLSALVDRLQPILARLAHRAFTLQIDLPTERARVWADAVQLEQLVMNLVVNARDAMLDGGTVHVRIDVTPEHAVLVVRDSGTGMPEDVRARIFEPFFTTKDEGKGTGLGLAVVADVARRWQGQIDVESEVGVGTTFRVRFPRLG